MKRLSLIFLLLAVTSLQGFSESLLRDGKNKYPKDSIAGGDKNVNVLSEKGDGDVPGDEKPLLTLACISDIHTERSLIDCENLDDIALRGSFIQTLQRIKEEEKIDVMMLGGDCTSDATISVANWEQVRKLIASYSRKAFPSDDSCPVIYITGNHDYEVANWDNIPKPYNAGDYYTFPMKDDIGELGENDSFYEKADNGSLGTMSLLAAYHYVIHGFDFVILNCGKYYFKSAWDYTYSEESVQWVADKLAEIYAENPDKTVFFGLHVPFADSNSIRAASKGMASSSGEKLLKKTLSKYPNLIMLYGHDHGEDKAYTRVKTSQRVTHYDSEGRVIDTYDDTHVDGVTKEGDTGDPTVEEGGSFFLRNQANGLYLGYNSYNLAPVETKFKLTFKKTADKTFTATFDATNPSGSTSSSIHVGSNGYYSGGDASPLFLYEPDSDGDGTKAHRISEIEEGAAYMIVGKNGSTYYALSNATYNSGSAQRMQRVQVSLSSDLETLTLTAASNAILWIFEPYTEEVQPEATTHKWTMTSYASGKYMGFNSYNLATADDENTVSLELTNATTHAYAVKVDGSGSEANGNYMISSSSGRFSANAEKYPTYFYHVTTMDDSQIVAEKVAEPVDGECYLVVAENAKDQTLLYAVTNEEYAVTGSHRLVGLKVTEKNGAITLPASNSGAVWKMAAYQEKEGTPSFFSAFMGSMRYYYNTIDPGDMPVETPNIVQALMVYVYADRVELHMKNYNKYGTINGITVNQYLTPYISYRKVEVADDVSAVELKDAHVETYKVYDLNGRQLAGKPDKGVFIYNGKKYISK